ncbi:MAG TPA: hypothetical protein VG033_08055 [Candidatus Acidoferrales bacterium]|nr:hypothetical protein [Candidatus Acidoferrales bacterium]
MQRMILRTIALASFALLVALGAAGRAQAQDVKAPYPNMAPLDQYLMERSAEIALARSAAPDSISRDAEVRVLGRHGYETAVEGKNGFMCLVERSWMSPFDFPEFWNPKMRGPICFNPPAVRSILPLTFKRTELALAGLSKSQMIDGIKAFDAKGLPALEPGAMCYMLSKQGYLNDSAGHWVPHLMFYVPLTDPKSWGADLPGSPVMLNPQFQGAPEPITEFMVPVSNWSDGTAAPKDAH